MFFFKKLIYFNNFYRLRAELEDSKQKAMKELENAKKEVELQLDSQKCAYESEIKKLGNNLEEQKKALEEVKRKKKELEQEKHLLAAEIEINNKIKSLEKGISEESICPYKTNFLQDLEDLLNETTADAEAALSVKTSLEAMKTGGVSLHEIQLLVREATERCREVGVNYVSTNFMAVKFHYLILYTNYFMTLIFIFTCFKILGISSTTNNC